MYLFPRFLDNPKEYAKAEKFWAQTWSALVKRLNLQNRWQMPWFENKFGNGKPCLDGNPIFSSVDRRRRLALRVLQVPPESERDTYFEYSTSTFGKGDPEQLEELVISFVLTDETLAKATDLMTKWAKYGSLNDSARPAKAHRKARTAAPRRRVSRA